MTVIKQRNLFLCVHNDKAILNQDYRNKSEFIFEYIGENFLIKSVDSLYLTKDLDLVKNIEDASQFSIESDNLISDEKIIIENVYLVEFTSSPLIEAIKNIKKFEELIDSYGGQNYVDDFGNTDFIYSFIYNRIEIVRYMIENKLLTNINIQNNEGNTVLMFIYAIYDIEIIKYLINSSNINIQNNYGYTTFMMLCEKGKIEIIKYLVESNLINETNVNMKDYNGTTAFMIACKYGKLSIVEYLIERKLINSLNINVEDNVRFTAFMYACKFNSKKIVVYLFESELGQYIDIKNTIKYLFKDYEKFTPLGGDSLKKIIIEKLL